MEIKHNFVRGRMDQDTDERLVSNGLYREALNTRVSTSDASDEGVLENILGNTQLTNLGFTNGRTIGRYEDGSFERIYWFVTSDSSDAVVEWNRVTNQAVKVLESLPGGTLNFSRDNLITGVNLIINGTNMEDNLLAWTDDRNPPRLINIERAKTYPLNGFTEADISLLKAPPLNAPTTLLRSIPGETNNIEDSFFTFAYRFRYADGEFSALSPFTYYQFLPNDFNINFQTYENEGMVNSANAVDIGFNTGGRNVTDIQLVFKESNSNNVSIIETFNKSDRGWADNTDQEFTFSNNKQYTILDATQLFRTFDNVPRLAKAQELIGNRLIFGNYLEGYDIEDENGDPIEIDYTVGIDSTSTLGLDITAALSNSNRNANFIFPTGTELNQGGNLIFTIRIENELDSSISGTFPGFFVLERDYTSTADLVSSSEFQNFVGVTFTDAFYDSLEVSAGITIVSRSPFVATSGTDRITLTSPSFTFNPPGSSSIVLPFTTIFREGTNLTYRERGSTTTLKSNRDYEVGIVYRDSEGRSSTVLTSATNTVNVPPANSTSQNKLRVTINNEAPAWADNFRIAVKQNSGVYQTIYTGVFYEEGLFRWVLLDGANRQKVQEGDTLVVKSDLGGPLNSLVTTKVIEIRNQPRDFIEGNTNAAGDDIVEVPGLYMKIQPRGFDMDFREDLFREFSGNSSGPTQAFTDPPFTENGQETGTPIGLTPGSIVEIDLRIEDRGSNPFVATYDRQFTVQGTYTSVEAWFNAEVGDLGSFGTDFTRDGDGFGFENNRFFILTHIEGPSFLNIHSSVNWQITSSSGTLIFETEPASLDANSALFFEGAETFQISNGLHLGNIQGQTTSDPAIVELDFFNAYVQGNGAESYQVRDDFNSSFLNIDLRPTSTSVEPYRAIRRFADLTYSEPYNENTNVNGLNEFNLARLNFKEDLDKRYASIQRLYTRDTNIVVFQEDKVSYVLFDKDLLFNSDGSGNVTSTDRVLGQQVAYTGEYGISRNPESFAFWGSRIYFTDAKRGAVLRLSVDGLNEISQYGMFDYFKDLFRDNPFTYKFAEFDPDFDEYVLSVVDSTDSNNQVTLAFKENTGDGQPGWTTFYSYQPDYLVGMNSSLYTFNNGDLFLHNSGDVTTNYNNFYGTQYPSRLNFMFNDSPSDIKAIRALQLEGNGAWDVVLTSYITDLDDFYRSTLTISEFERREGQFYAYVRRNENNSDRSSKAAYGIGRVTEINGNIVTINGGSGLLTAGDELYIGPANTLVGTIQNVTGNLLIMTATTGLNVNDYVFGLKNARIEGASLRGYTINSVMTRTSGSKIELFAATAQVFNSLP